MALDNMKQKLLQEKVTWIVFQIYLGQEDMARYAGLLLAPAEGFGLCPRPFLPFKQKRELFMLFWPIFGNFWSPVVTLVTFGSNLSHFEGNPKKPQKSTKKSKKIQKNSEK